MAVATDTRKRLISTTKRLLWTQGYSATGLNQIIAESGAPRGSIYFHFPGGKEHLTVEALRDAGAAQATVLRESYAKRGVADALRASLRAFTRAMHESDWKRGCPLATVTLEAASLSEPIRQVCDAAFTEWREIFAEALVRDGIPGPRAAALATFWLSSVEGALVLSRAARSIAPLEGSVNELVALIDSEPRVR
jgi:TetR/AcrR family transcriptional repressor of lmrAB and yxaGH operons